MKHILIVVAMAISCILVAIADVIIARTIGLNLFTLKIWLIIPAGALIVGMLGTSGAILARLIRQRAPERLASVVQSADAA
jgi:hypothetical protein